MARRDEKETFEFADVRSLLTQDNPEGLVRVAEEIGTLLGMVAVSPSLAVQIYRDLESPLRQFERTGDKTALALFKPRLAYIMSRMGLRERPAYERLHYVLLEGIGCVLRAEGIERPKTTGRLRLFVKSMISYMHYARMGGVRLQPENVDAGLLKRFNELQLEISRLHQFIAESSDRAKVFLSYSHKDQDFVGKLREDLENRGVSIWHDDKDMDIGDIVSEAVSRGIEQSWYFLVVVSTHSVQSNWVKYELDEAYEEHIGQGKKILPVLIGELEDDDIPRRLKKHLYADFRDESKHEEVFERLYRSIVRGMKSR